MQLDHVPRAIQRDGLMHHGEVQPDRRLSKARQLDAYHRPARGAALGHRAGCLVGLKAIASIAQPKRGRLRRIPVRTPATSQASVLRRVAPWYRSRCLAAYSRRLARVTVTSWVDSVTLIFERGVLLG